MCGIAGAIGDMGPDAAPLQRMVRALRLRGPDDSGLEVITRGERACWLGNTRLSILDLSPAGHMPMEDPPAGNWITYNGEVYNFLGLRRALESAGEIFKSRSDTEVILKLYRLEGPGFLAKLRGMFALAIWDEGRRELFLARDRVGKKPLYHSRCPSGQFIFASEIRAIMSSGLIAQRLDPDGLRHYLTNGFVVSPETILENVHSLLPGHWIRVGMDGEIRETRCYWRPDAAGASAAWKEPDELDGIRDSFEEAVKARLVSDVPVGIFLSGGMDSSAIVGAVSRSHEQVRTFSVSFPGTDLDEAAHSRRVASHWGTSHTEVPIEAGEFLGWLPEALEAMDQPSFDGINSFFVSKAAHEAGLKVVLSGIGADEVFGGYPTFKAIPLMTFLSPIARHFPALFTMAGLGGGAARNLGPLSVRAGFRLADLLGVRWRNGGRTSFEIAFYQLTQALFPSWSRRALLGEGRGGGLSAPFPMRFGLPNSFVEFLAPQLAGRSEAGIFSMLAWRLFLGERCLRDVDSMSMGVSLEVRAPFTDQEFVQRALRIPASRRCAGPPDKPFEHRLLEPFLKGAWEPRAKQGFVMPFVSWLSTAEGRSRIGGLLEDREIISSVGLVPGVVRSLWRAHLESPARVPWSRVWAIYVLATWCRRHHVGR